MCDNGPVGLNYWCTVTMDQGGATVGRRDMLASSPGVHTRSDLCTADPTKSNGITVNVHTMTFGVTSFYEDFHLRGVW